MSLVSSVIIIVALVSLDQLIKYLVVTFLKPVETVEIIKNVLSFTYVENPGAVFGSFSSHTVILTIVTVLLLVVTIYIIASKQIKSKFINVCLLLMVAGGIGNVIDRIRLHYVVDYIHPTFVNFAVFNFADCLITVSAFAILFSILFDLYKTELKPKIKSKSEKMK